MDGLEPSPYQAEIGFHCFVFPIDCQKEYRISR